MITSAEGKIAKISRREAGEIVEESTTSITRKRVIAAIGSRLANVLEETNVLLSMIRTRKASLEGDLEPNLQRLEKAVLIEVTAENHLEDLNLLLEALVHLIPPEDLAEAKSSKVTNTKALGASHRLAKLTVCLAEDSSKMEGHALMAKTANFGIPQYAETSRKVIARREMIVSFCTKRVQLHQSSLQGSNPEAVLTAKARRRRRKSKIKLRKQILPSPLCQLCYFAHRPLQMGSCYGNQHQCILLVCRRRLQAITYYHTIVST